MRRNRRRRPDYRAGRATGATAAFGESPNRNEWQRHDVARGRTPLIFSKRLCARGEAAAARDAFPHPCRTEREAMLALRAYFDD